MVDVLVKYGASTSEAYLIVDLAKKAAVNACDSIGLVVATAPTELQSAVHFAALRYLEVNISEVFKEIEAAQRHG